MKKIIYTLAGVVLTTTLMMGCGSKTNTTDTQNKQETQSTSTNDASTQQKDIQKADLEGEVTSISGSKITLKLIKTPDAPTGGTVDGSQGKAPAGDSSKDADKTKSADNKDGHDSKAPDNMKVEYTGETKDITISDEVKIKAMSMGTQGAESKELAFKDIKAGDVLQITYSDKDKGTISAINVRQAVSQK